MTSPVLTVVTTGPVPEHAHRGHPERPARLEAVLAGVADLDLGGDLDVVDPRPATDDELARVHATSHLAALDRLAATGGRVDADTYLTKASAVAARRAAGAGLVALDRAESTGVPALVAARPPGHHALADRAMGFCLVNTVAVMAATLAHHGARVAIIDWDVHHGNGTEALFWDDPRVLYASLHQWPCYPGTGAAEDVGGGRGRGATVNVPLPPGATGDVARAALERIVTPTVTEFHPDWVLVSAGFDAHRDDPLADLALSAADFGHLATLVSDWAPHPGRVVVVLEGGYDLGALRRSVRATLGALVGDAGPPPDEPEPPTSGGPGRDQLTTVLARRRRALAGGRLRPVSPGAPASLPSPEGARP